ncbi:MAG TPA: glycosyltransferase, partial [Chromatiales bacterium]|nr:glycosyltransferase [Chromatiales bacterium]
KFEFTSDIIGLPEWPALALGCSAFAMVLFLLLLIDGHGIHLTGRFFLAVATTVAVTAAVWVAFSYFNRYLDWMTLLTGLLLFTGSIGVVVVFLVEAHEWAEARWIRRWRRQFMAPPVAPDAQPRVSIHVVAYNEPPDMLRRTLNALAQLDYPDYEVVVVDNNTKDPSIWRPVEEHCRRLGARFRFFHVDPLEGYKAGALNYALERTDRAAEIVAVIDADYLVDRDWLQEMVPHFARPDVAIVQSPQDYHDDEEGLFKSMIYSEYKGFFHIGMMTRNERNAIIQHGTMTMVRREVLEDVGGWGDWTITEDADLGLRIFAAGYEAVYSPRSYGRGVMPDTFINYKKQRHRWAFGAMQILRRYRRELLGLRPSGLSAGQRYHFVAGWLPWIADGFNILFTLAALIWSAAMIWMPERIDPPLAAFTVLPVGLFLFKIFKLFYLYCTRIGEGCARSFAAALSGLALSHTIGRAVLSGIFTRHAAFFRTPKLEGRSGFYQAWLSVREESMLLIALWSAVLGISQMDVPTAWDLRLWVLALLIQSLPYLAAVVMAVISVLPSKSTKEASKATVRRA